MKEIRMNDEAYKRAENIAGARNISVSDLVENLVDSISEDRPPVDDDLGVLFAALDKGRNTKPVGRLRRHELHDRPVLHRY